MSFILQIEDRSSNVKEERDVFFTERNSADAGRGGELE